MAKEAKTIERRELRPELREDDPRTRAAKRAAEVRGNIGDMDEGTDEFRAPRAPDGWTYEWKRKSVMGQEDHAYMTQLLRTGWEPVPATRHPEMMPIGTEGNIERKGMVLMERPMELTDEVKALELKKARNQVRMKEGQLDPKGRGGMLDRADAHIDPKIKKGYEPMPIPDNV